MSVTTAAAPPKSDKAEAERPQEGLGFFRYARNFTTGLLKDAKFWSRFNAIPNGVIFVAQGVAGTLVLLGAAPLLAQAAGIAGCAALAGIGLYGIGYGFPRAWQSMEALCARTFPKFNPPRRARVPIQAFARKMAQKPWIKRLRNSRFARLKPALKTERRQDVFLAGLTLEGASASAVAAGFLIAPTVMSIPAITIAGALAVAGAGWMITTCVFDVYCSAKTLFQSFRDKLREEKIKSQALKAARSAAPPQAPEKTPEARPLVSSAAAAFNKTFNETFNTWADCTPKLQADQVPPRPGGFAASTAPRPERPSRP